MSQNVWSKWIWYSLCCQKKWVDELPPYQGGGGMINEVKKDEISYKWTLPTKFEAGTMQTAEKLVAFTHFTKSIQFIQDLGIKKYRK